MSNVLTATVKDRDGTAKPVEREELLHRARAVAPIIEEEANEIEERADITDRARSAIAEADLFWLLAPPEHGGQGADFGTAIEVMEEIARADGSTGWAFFCNVVATSAAMVFGSDALVRDAFDSGQRGIFCGQFGAVGKAVRVEGGFRISGKHQFASGSSNATWLGAGQKLYDDKGNVILDDKGQPITFAAYFPKDQIRITGNWNVAGLNGTGSYDYEVPEQFVPAERVVDGAAVWQGGGSYQRRGPARFRVGMFTLGHMGHAGIALGMAKRALQEIARIAATKSRLGYAAPLAEFPVFRDGFGFNEASYWAARANVLDFYTALEATCERGEEITAEQHARVMQMTLFTHKVTRDIITFCHGWAGSSAVRNPSAIGRCYRDISVAINHAINDPMLMQNAFTGLFDPWASGRLKKG